MGTQKLVKNKPIMIICHGLNLNPERMMDLYNFYTSIGFKCHNLILPGHNKQSDIHLWSKFQLSFWTNYAKKAYINHLNTAKQEETSLYLCAYSIGALVFQDLFIRFPSLKKPTKIIYFAPALHIKGFKNILHLLKPIPGKMRIPSFNLPSYRVWSYTTLSVYLAYIELEKRVLAHGDTIWAKNPQTLIIIDPKDELINYLKLSQRTPKHIHFLEVDKKMSLLKFKGNHHLIIDQFSLGATLWNKVTLSIKDFLNH